MSINLFVLHSPIAELILIKLIQNKTLIPEKTKILSVREYLPISKPVKELESVSISKIWPFHTHSIAKRVKFWATWKIRQSFRKNIVRLTNYEDFSLYAPYLYLLPIYEITQMPQCKGIYYYEEGIGSFGPINRFEKFRIRGEKKLLSKIFFKVNYGIHAPTKHKFFDFLHSKYKGAFAFSEECFPVASRQLLEWPKPADIQDIIVLDDYLKYEKSSIMLMDLFYARHGLTWEAMFFPLLKFLTIAKNKGIKKIYFKFHPDQVKDKAFRKRFENLFSHQEGILFEEISSQISIEMLSVLTTNTYYVFYSSLALYVRKNPSNKVFSLHKLVSSMYTLKEDALAENVPQSFWENTTMIEP